MKWVGHTSGMAVGCPYVAAMGNPLRRANQTHEAGARASTHARSLAKREWKNANSGPTLAPLPEPGAAPSSY